ncbi:hypothetical protein WR25_18090 [Diploscapter pachys]|uniref:Ubiquitin-like protease family profile domain-containing protein n=1 Tax=Diploscapter pachys TaxID=2018661 RepID=A0A2A2LU83_9BILA|nr:hypothetical protein WR25_18090 [Diploscapter pachys]
MSAPSGSRSGTRRNESAHPEPMRASTQRGQLLLIFRGCHIYSNDLEELETGAWLMDSVLSFAAYYAQKQLKNIDAERMQRMEIISPPVTELVKYAGDEDNCEHMVGKLNLAEKERVCFMMSDSTCPDLPMSGSHWRLVVYDRPNAEFKVYDSLSCALDDPSENMQLTNMTRYLAKTMASAKEPAFRAMPCPRQMNSSDCGIYVMEFLENIYLWNTLDLSNLTFDPMQARRKWLARINDVIRLRSELGSDYKSSDDETDSDKSTDKSPSNPESARSNDDHAVSANGNSSAGSGSRMDTGESDSNDAAFSSPAPANRND